MEISITVSTSRLKYFCEVINFSSDWWLLPGEERIRPETILWEGPPAAFDEYFASCISASLESRAVRILRERYPVEIVPVDLPTPPRDFFENNRAMFERIEERSHEYRRLVDLHSTYSRLYGFSYLNSHRCSKLWLDVYAEMLSTIRKINDPRLMELYELWNRTNDCRDSEMVKNVLRYCGERVFDRSVFLVGTAHRQSIIDKATAQSAMHSTTIQWDFAGWVSQK